MTGKRFTRDEHTGYLYDNGEIVEDVMKLLNELHEKNQALKKQLQSEHQMLENAILLERTRMGKNCLKQFRDAIQ